MNQILERAEMASKYHEGMNCIGAAYFLLGIDNIEQRRACGFLEKDTHELLRVPTIEESVAIALEYTENPGFIAHMGVIHPNRNELFQRKCSGERLFSCSVEGFFDELKRYSGFQVAYFNLST